MDNQTKQDQQNPAADTVKTTTEIPVNPAPPPTTPTSDTPDGGKSTPAPVTENPTQGDGQK